MKQSKNAEQPLSRSALRKAAKEKPQVADASRIRDAQQVAARTARMVDLGTKVNEALATGDHAAADFAKDPGAFVGRVAEANGFAKAEIADLKGQFDHFDVSVHVGPVRGVNLSGQELLQALLRQFASSPAHAAAIKANPVAELEKLAQLHNVPGTELDKARAALESALGIHHLPRVEALESRIVGGLTISTGLALPAGLNLVIGERT